MKNFETFTEEIKKQLLNVKLMYNTNIRLIKYYDIKEDSYFTIVDFKDGHSFNGGYSFYIICETTVRKDNPEIMEMKVDFYDYGDYHIFCDYGKKKIQSRKKRNIVPKIHGLSDYYK